MTTEISACTLNSFLPFSEAISESKIVPEFKQAFHQLCSAPFKKSSFVEDNRGCFSSLIKPQDFLKDMPEYVIVKVKEYYPEYYDYSDTDILCSDRELTKNHILNIARTYVDKGFQVRVKKTASYTHIDFYPPCKNGNTSRLNYRFDLTDPFSKPFGEHISPDFYKDLIASKSLQYKNGQAVYLPEKNYELAYRYLEFLYYKKTRPDKIKHLEYIKDANSTQFLELLNQYSTRPYSQEELHKHLSRLPLKKPRYEAFIIWGHGLKDESSILSRIRDYKNFELVMIRECKVNNIAKTILQIYKDDLSKLKTHILSKTRYLEKTPPKILLVLAKNLDPKERVYGTGRFAKTQCMRAKELKELIRNQFNPRFENGLRTEEHIIHSSDNEKEANLILNVFNQNKLDLFKRWDNTPYRVPFHRSFPKSIVKASLPISKVYANILGKGKVPVEKTPHFAYIQGNKQPYIDYYYSNRKSFIDDHSPEAFSKLIENFDINYEPLDKRISRIIVKQLEDGSYMCLDGVHRLAILKSMQIKEVPVLIFDY